jgi:glycosyltransferase involved in cell wall biosynthesis
VSTPLRIVMTVDPELAVPPRHYGGIERVVDMLARGLTERGHEVHLFANPASTVPVNVRGYRGLRSGLLADTLRNALDLRRFIEQVGDVDVVHSFGRLAYLLPVMRHVVPKIQSYQRPVTRRVVRTAALLGGRGISFSACSEACAAPARTAGGRWFVIHNGVPLETYTFSSSVPDDAPLVFLGRVERIKGAHTAIEVARRSGRRLLITGNRADSGPEREYFEREIAPHCDGHNVVYLGPRDDAQKNALLGGAAALLFPIEWEEPFGIVMAEALACGTPVIGARRGAVPEVVEDGRTGFVSESIDDMVDAVRHLPRIDRGACRATFEARFSDRVIVDRYEAMYRTCIGAAA